MSTTGFRNGSYATVWETNGISDTMTKARISVSRKDKQTGNYETDFSGFVYFVGSACAKKAMSLKQRDRIKLGEVDVTVRYDKEKQKEFTNFKVFGFELQNENAQPQQQTQQKQQRKDEYDGDTDQLPF